MSDGDDHLTVGHPKQRKSHDLSKNPKVLRQKGYKAPDLVHGDRSDSRSPDDMMRQMGFDPTKNMNPLQFLIAVMNDDLDLIFKNEKRRLRMEGKGGLAVNYRIEAAKTAAKYIHMELPKVTMTQDDKNGFGESLTNAITQGNERIRTRRMIIEEVERISPNIPLAPASYPPAFQDDVIEADDDILAEGDTDYDPDAE